MHTLEIENLTKRFQRIAALTEVSFNLDEGSIGGLVGPNGAGKTTLFSIVAGFLRPTAGQVRIDGVPRDDIGSVNGRLAILPQDARFQRGITIQRQFLWYARLVGFEEGDAMAEVTRVLDLVDLRDAAVKEGDQLSHGMHKRMAIAQALIGDAPLLLLDEPTSGLDPVNARVIRDLVRSLRGQRTVLISSHNLAEVADVCDHVTILDHGRVVESKPIVAFTQAEAAYTITLEGEASDALVAAIGAMQHIAAVKVATDGRRLGCVLAPEGVNDAQIPARLMAVLGEHGMGFTEFQKGSTLEDRFLEVTGRAKGRPKPS